MQFPNRIPSVSNGLKFLSKVITPKKSAPKSVIGKAGAGDSIAGRNPLHAHHKPEAKAGGKIIDRREAQGSQVQQLSEPLGEAKSLIPSAMDTSVDRDSAHLKPKIVHADINMDKTQSSNSVWEEISIFLKNPPSTLSEQESTHLLSLVDGSCNVLYGNLEKNGIIQDLSAYVVNQCLVSVQPEKQKFAVHALDKLPKYIVEDTPGLIPNLASLLYSPDAEIKSGAIKYLLFLSKGSYFQDTFGGINLIEKDPQLLHNLQRVLSSTMEDPDRSNIVDLVFNIFAKVGRIDKYDYGEVMGKIHCVAKPEDAQKVRLVHHYTGGLMPFTNGQNWPKAYYIKFKPEGHKKSVCIKVPTTAIGSWDNSKMTGLIRDLFPGSSDVKYYTTYYKDGERWGRD